MSAAELTPTDVSPVDAAIVLTPEQAALNAAPIIAAILQWLPPAQRCSLLSVSRAWRRAGDDPDIWGDLIPEQRRRSLIAAIAANRLALVKKRVLIYKITSADFRANNFSSLEIAFGHESIEIAQWLADYFTLTVDEVRMIKYGRQSMFHNVCIRGHLVAAQWLSRHFSLTPADARVNYNWTLGKTCENGHLATAQWLTQHFGLNADDIRMHNCYALYWACYHGYLPMVQWLATEFELTAADIRFHHCQAFRMCCGNGHLSTVQWLVTHFDLDHADIRTLGYDALRMSCMGGHLSLAQWLASRFDLTLTSAEDAAHYSHALAWACIKGHLATAQWLVEYFGLTASDAYGAQVAIDVLTDRVGTNSARAWLISHFNLLELFD